MDKQQPQVTQERVKTSVEKRLSQDIIPNEGPLLKKLLISILQNKEVEKRNVKDLNIISTGLRQFEFFRNLEQERGEESIKLCALSIGYEKFEPGKNVIVHGEKGDKFYIILQGVLEVHVPNTAGEFIKVSELVQGQSFGELALLNDSPRRATIKTASNCGLATLSKKSYLKIIADMEERVIKKKIEFLQSVALFKPISNRSLHEYIFYFKPLLFKWKECVYDIGQDAEFVYIIKQGEFVIQKTSKRLFVAEDKEKKVIQESKSDHVCELAILGIGEMFGEIDCLLNEKRSLQVICHSQSAEVLVVTKKHFIGRIMDNYAVKKSFLKNYLANKMQHSSNRLQEIYQVLSIVEDIQTDGPLKSKENTLETICSSTENQPTQRTTRSFSPRQFSKGGSSVFRARNFAQEQLNSVFIQPLQVIKRISPIIKTQKTAPIGLEKVSVKSQMPIRPIQQNSSQKLRENLLNTLLKTNKPSSTLVNSSKNVLTPLKSSEKEVNQQKNRSPNNLKSSETPVTKDASNTIEDDDVLHFPDLNQSLLFSPQKRLIRYSSMSARNNQLNTLPDNNYVGNVQEEMILKTDNIESRIQKLNKIKLQICQAHNIDTSPTSIKQIGTVEKMELPIYLLLKLRSYSSQSSENKYNNGSPISTHNSNSQTSPKRPSNLRWELHQQGIQNIINQIKQVEDLENHISPKNIETDIDQDEFQDAYHQPVSFNTEVYSPQHHKKELRATQTNREKEFIQTKKIQQRTNQLLKTRGHPPNNNTRLQPIVEHISKSLII